MKRQLFWLITAILIALAPTLASADVEYNFDKSTWPIPLVKRPILLAPSMLELSGDTLIIDASADTFGDPILVAPDVYYGLNEKLMVGIDHTSGICLAGDSCKRYNDVALNGVYSLMHGDNLHAAALLGVASNSVDPFVGGLNLGLIGKVRIGSVAVLTGAQLYVGLFGRDEQAAAPVKEYVRIPVQIQVQMQPQVAFLIDFSLSGPLDGFGSNDTMLLGLGGLYTLGRRVDVGASFAFTDLTQDGGRFDGRRIYVRANVRL